MRSTLFLLICLFLAGCGKAKLTGALAAGDTETDRKAFRGLWEVAEWTEGGWREPDTTFDQATVFEDIIDLQRTRKRKDSSTGQVRFSVEKVRIRFALDATKSPREFDGTTAEQRSVVGIYAIEGDSLRICFTDAENGRPMAFPRPGDTEEARRMTQLRLNRATFQQNTAPKRIGTGQ